MGTTQTIPRTEQTGIEIIDKIREIDPEKNIAIIAVGKLKNKVDMIRFYDSYVIYLKNYGPAELMKHSPEEMAKQNILAATGYYNKRTRSKWHSLIKEIENSEYKNTEQPKILRK